MGTPPKYDVPIPRGHGSQTSDDQIPVKGTKGRRPNTDQLRTVHYSKTYYFPLSFRRRPEGPFTKE